MGSRPCLDDVFPGKVEDLERLLEAEQWHVAEVDELDEAAQVAWLRVLQHHLASGVLVAALKLRLEHVAAAHQHVFLEDKNNHF